MTSAVEGIDAAGFSRKLRLGVQFADLTRWTGEVLYELVQQPAVPAPSQIPPRFGAVPANTKNILSKAIWLI